MFGVCPGNGTVFGVAAQPVRLELLDDLVEIGLGHVHLVERLHGGETRPAAREARCWRGRRSKPCSCPLLGEGAGVLDQRQAGAHRTCALALAAAARALQCLRFGLHRQDRVAERNGVARGDVHQPVVGVVAHRVVVRGLAADDAAQRHAAVEAGTARRRPG